MRHFLARVAVVVLLCDVAVVGVRAFGPEPGVRVHEVGGPAGTVVVLPAGQAVVSGVADSLTVAADVVDPVPAPFTVEAERAVIADALVGPDRLNAVWNGGPPLRLEGSGDGLDPSPATVEIAPGSVTVRLDGSPRTLLPGRYRTSAPVAVGAAGLATPRDGLDFAADAATTLEATGVVRATPHALHLSGPGTVDATGQFRVKTSDGEVAATRLRFGPGPFELALTPAPGTARWTVTATLRGPLVKS